MKTILVTGGAGFIGRHLCAALLSEGHKVICLDNLFTGSKTALKSLEENTLFSFVEHDIVEPIYFSEKIDEIYNLACPASVPHYQQNAIHTLKTNTIGVINMLGLAKKMQAKILQTSTSEIYGEPLISPQREDYRGNVSSIGPRACYDEGKRCAEALFFEYYRSHAVSIKVVRIFNTYGPGMAIEDGRAVSNFVVQALRGQDITIYGQGTQTRSFCYVDDLVDGLQRMMTSSKEVTGPINLGNPEEITINDLAVRVLAETRSKSSLVYNPLPIDDPLQRRPDISKAKEVLKWVPKTPLSVGLEKTIAYFKEKLI